METCKKLVGRVNPFPSFASFPLPFSLTTFLPPLPLPSPLLTIFSLSSLPLSVNLSPSLLPPTHSPSLSPPLSTYPSISPLHLFCYLPLLYFPQHPLLVNIPLHLSLSPPYFTGYNSCGVGKLLRVQNRSPVSEPGVTPGPAAATSGRGSWMPERLPGCSHQGHQTQRGSQMPPSMRLYPERLLASSATSWEEKGKCIVYLCVVTILFMGAGGYRVPQCVF